jgi:glycosyltransferase involved in cell wall biosynthesis
MKRALGPVPSISVIIPVHNGGDAFRQCLSSLAAAVPQPDEIIVVADGDTDGSWRLAQEHGAQVLRIFTPGGPAKARNAGARLAKGDILFFIDADVMIPPDAVGKVSAIFQSDSDLSAMFGSYDDQPGASNFLSQYRNLLHHYVHQTGSRDASTFWSGCGAIRRELFLSIGGFKESYFRPAIEDIELGYRLKLAGHSIKLEKDLQVKHLKRWSALSLIKTDFFYRALPWTELILEGHGLVNDLNLKYSSRLSVISVYSLLFTLLGVWWYSEAGFLASLFGFLLLGLNAPLYSFFLRKRGIIFTLQTIPWHWLYFFYSGLAFAVGLARSLFWRPMYTRICQYFEI